MTLEEFQARIDACFVNLPTPEEVIAWANQNDFKFHCGSIGSPNCGCAITAVILMRYPDAFKDSLQFVDDMQSPPEILADCAYGEVASPNDRRPIYEGFDDLATDDENHPFYQFGSKLAKLAFA